MSSTRFGGAAGDPAAIRPAGPRRPASGVIIGIDVGTTSTKAVAIDAAWRVLAEARQEYPTRFVGDNGAEQDPRHWWRAATWCVREVLRDAGVAAESVAAIGVSSQAPSLVLLDADGRPVRPASLWMDRRGQGECAARAEAAAEVLALTGNRLDSYYAAPKLAWLLAAEPELADTVHRVVMANGYLVYRLTGQASIDSGHAGLSLLNDLDTGTWSPRLARLWGVPADWLPAIVDPSTVVGTVTAEAAAETGLTAGIPVVAGLVDGAAASLEAGVVRHGDVCEMTGQSTVINAAVDIDGCRASTGSLTVMPYPIPGHHLVFGSMVATGGILRWFRDQLGDAAGEPAAFAQLDALAATAPPGGNGLVMLPYFLGERSPVWDADARGAIVGLSMATTRADLVRAILEGTSYGLAHNLAEMSRWGLRPDILRVVGGGAGGHTWNQIKADVTGLPVVLPRHAMGAPVGVAMVAGLGVGLVNDLAQAAADRFEAAQRIEPDPLHHTDYQARFEIYRGLYPALREVNAALARLR